MKKWIVIAVVAALLLAGMGVGWRAMTQNPHDLGLAGLAKAAGEAYVFGYPLVLMDATREQMFADAGLTGYPDVAPNQFVHIRIPPEAGHEAVVRPNVDTLYSIAWLDLSDGPVVMRWPDMQDRYWVYQVLDAWTDVAGAPGTRTTGNDAGGVVITGPGQEVPALDGMAHMPVATEMAWVIGRIEVAPDEDLAPVHVLQDGFTLPVDSVGYSPAPGEHGQRPPDQVAAMPPEVFFNRLAALMQDNPPRPADRAAVDQQSDNGQASEQTVRESADFGWLAGWAMDRADEQTAVEQLHAIGFAPDLSAYDTGDFGWLARWTMDRGVGLARRLLVRETRQQSLPHGPTNWLMMRSGPGDYGTDYELRAGVALIGLGANLPADAIYPNTSIDSEGRGLHGRHAYRLHFAPDELPPVHAFWSLTLYDENGFLVDTGTGRYALGDRDDLGYDEDGGLTLHVGAEPPRDLPESNWLPAPAGEPFALTARLYWPKDRALHGDWVMPPVERVSPK